MNWRDGLRGRPVLDAQGEKLGIIEEVYPDPDGVTTWALLGVGTLDIVRRTLVPVEDALDRQDALCVPYTKATVHAAPQVGEPPTHEDRVRLGSFYGLGQPRGDPDLGMSSFGGGSEVEPVGCPAYSTEGAGTDVRHSTLVQSRLLRPDAPEPDLLALGGYLAEYGQLLVHYGQQLAFAGQRLAEDSALTVSSENRPLEGRQR